MIILLTISLVTLSVLVLLIQIRYKTRSWLILLLVPFLLFNIGFSWHTVSDLLGKPRHSTIQDHSQFLYAVVSNRWIYLLVAEPDTPQPIYYKIPYSEKLEQQLNKANEKAKNGERVMLKKNNTQDDSEYVFYNWEDGPQFQPKK